ncbi:hypothetical protein AX15_002952 [Amanita polypyramis BW_CC]|nr:hypothetical protein AX15_002952 [Amanita polypyramis BW_CC]
MTVGCPTRYKAHADQQLPRVCPHCHNGALIAAKRTTWFELFFIPLVPISKKRVWLCHICHWSTPLVVGQDFPTAGQNSYPMEAQGWQQPVLPGYQPSYTYNPHPKTN